MNARTENDLRALLPALLAVAERSDETRQEITERVIRLISKCEEINNRAPVVPDGDREERVALKFAYRNYKNEMSTRWVYPQEVRYGTSEHHPQPQWLLEAFDAVKMAERTFAMRGISGITESAAPAPVQPEAAATINDPDCVCGHDTEDHRDCTQANECMAPGCGCQMFNPAPPVATEWKVGDRVEYVGATLPRLNHRIGQVERPGPHQLPHEETVSFAGSGCWYLRRADLRPAVPVGTGEESDD